MLYKLRGVVMNFSLEKLKELYEKYAVIENGKKEVVIMKNDTEQAYNSDIKLVTSVKFAYAWVNTICNNCSKNFLEANNVDYELAFNEEAEYLYDIIMAICIDFMETTGDMIKCEALINFILEDDDVDESVISIIQKLYSNDKAYKSFEDWIIYVVKSINAQS